MGNVKFTKQSKGKKFIDTMIEDKEKAPMEHEDEKVWASGSNIISSENGSPIALGELRESNDQLNDNLFNVDRNMIEENLRH